jgi:hypothetical protein
MRIEPFRHPRAKPETHEHGLWRFYMASPTKRRLPCAHGEADLDAARPGMTMKAMARLKQRC